MNGCILKDLSVIIIIDVCELQILTGMGYNKCNFTSID